MQLEMSTKRRDHATPVLPSRCAVHRLYTMGTLDGRSCAECSDSPSLLLPLSSAYSSTCRVSSLAPSRPGVEKVLPWQMVFTVVSLLRKSPTPRCSNFSKRNYDLALGFNLINLMGVPKQHGSAIIGWLATPLLCRTAVHSSSSLRLLESSM
jgi:hypothetical protein